MISKDSLNPEQKEAVLHTDGPLLVLAGAGSGKTRVLTHRVANLVTNHNVHPARILAVTFTNKAANEMKGRLRELVGEKSSSLWVSTFHSACVRILRSHATKLDYPKNFTIYDEQDSRATLKNVLKELGIDEKRYSASMFLAAIDKAKNDLVFPDNPNFVAMNKQNADVYLHYQKALHASGAMDFGDLLANTTVLLTKHPSILDEYRSLLKYILVDEFQDTNKAQYVLLKLLTTPRNNLFVVGDDDQSIYSFRGAIIEHILSFEKDFPDTKIIRLEKNYRSTKTILDAANSVISKSPSRLGKTLWTENEVGPKLLGYVGSDESDEATFVANQIRSLLDTGTSLKDIAVFYRTNAQSRAIEEALITNDLPYRIFGGLKFYERKEIKDIIGYLRVLSNEKDDQAFLRVVNTPTRGIGATSIEKVRLYAHSHGLSLLEASKVSNNKQLTAFIKLMEEFKSSSNSKTLSGLIRDILEKTEYEKKLLTEPMGETRIENLRELEAIARSFEGERVDQDGILEAFLDRVSLSSSADVDENDERGYVSLMTLHLAKGLEFPYVFLTGMEEGLLPHYRAMENPVEEEEERRLCYVGITRAMRVLYLTHAHCRGMFTGGSQSGGAGFFRIPSRYISDIPTDFIEPLTQGFFEVDDLLVDVQPQSTVKRRKFGASTPASIDTVSIGLRVDHPTFGEGVVLDIEDPMGDDKEISVVVVKFDEFDDEMKLTWKWSRLIPLSEQ